MRVARGRSIRCRYLNNRLVYLGNLIIDQGEYVRARSLLEDSLERNKELGDTSSIADSLFDLARVCYVSQGDLTQAHPWLEESLALYQELGDKESRDFCQRTTGSS